MREMTNDTAKLIAEVNNGDDLPIVPDEEVQSEGREKSELDKLKKELSAVTYDDILNSTASYEKILTLHDEFALLLRIRTRRYGSSKKRSIRKRKRRKANTRSGGTALRSTRTYSALSFSHSTCCTISMGCFMT